MDAQLKYRLTGAVILVLLAVLFVPELLTGPKPSRPGAGPGPEPASTAADGAPLRSYDIDLSDPAAASPVEEEASTPPAPVPVTPATPPTLPPAAPTEDDGRAARSGTPAATSTIAGPAAVATQSPMRGFAVQVGSFSSRQSADRLAAELRGRRFEAFVSPVRTAGRQLFRVRVGPVEDRAAAQALAVRLKAAGQSGTIVPLP